MIENLAKAGPELQRAVEAFNAALQAEAVARLAVTEAEENAARAEDAVGRAYEALRSVARLYNLASW